MISIKYGSKDFKIIIMNLVPTNETIKNEKISGDKTKTTVNKLQPAEGAGEETLNLSLGIAYELGQIINNVNLMISDLDPYYKHYLPYNYSLYLWIFARLIWIICDIKPSISSVRKLLRFLIWTSYGSLNHMILKNHIFISFSINMEIAMSGIIFILLGLSNIWFNNIPNVVMTGFKFRTVAFGHARFKCSWVCMISVNVWNSNPITDQFSCIYTCCWTFIFFDVPHCSSLRSTQIYSFQWYRKVQNGRLGNFVVYRRRFRWNYTRNRYGEYAKFIRKKLILF